MLWTGAASRLRRCLFGSGILSKAINRSFCLPQFDDERLALWTCHELAMILNGRGRHAVMPALIHSAHHGAPAAAVGLLPLFTSADLNLFAPALLTD